MIRRAKALPQFMKVRSSGLVAPAPKGLPCAEQVSLAPLVEDDEYSTLRRGGLGFDRLNPADTGGRFVCVRTIELSSLRSARNRPTRLPAHSTSSAKSHIQNLESTQATVRRRCGRERVIQDEVKFLLYSLRASHPFQRNCPCLH